VDLTDYQGLYPNKARIPIGTLCELGWAYAFGIPVIAFCTYSDASYNKLIRAHPFTSNIVSAWFDSVDLAVEHMVHFYGE
jgi:nucleoside 2-deoxyribosyltransferase